jgi:FkbM family methyltransferase
MVTAGELRAALDEAGGAEAFASLSDFVSWMAFRLPSFAPNLARPSVPETAVRFKGCHAPLRMRSSTSDGNVAAQIFLRGEYAFLSAVSLRSNPVIVDLGANIGAFVHLADSLWPDASFVAIEPESKNAGMARANTENLANQGRLHFLEACVGAEAGRTSLDTSQGSWAVRMTEIGDSGDVRVITMAELIAETGITCIDLLKCDIEGAEAQLFSSCERWIGQVRNLVVEIHDPYMLDDLERDLTRAGSRLLRRATTQQPETVDTGNSTHLFSLP